MSADIDEFEDNAVLAAKRSLRYRHRSKAFRKLPESQSSVNFVKRMIQGRTTIGEPIGVADRLNLTPRTRRKWCTQVAMKSPTLSARSH